MNLASGRRLVWLLQAVLTAALVAFVWRAVRGRWSELNALDFDLQVRAGWIAAAATLVLLTYALLIEAWRRILAGWGQSLRYRDAVRIWTVANLGRYLPGKVWAVAGLALLAQREGVAAWAAVGSSVVVQALAIGTGVAVVVATVPGSSPVWLGGAAAAATGTIVVLSWPPAVRLLASLIRGVDLRPVAMGSLAAAGAVTLVSWVAYGVAFWCVAHGTLGDAAGLPLSSAVGVFAAGYIVGLVFLLAPAGVGAREAVFLPMLAPTLGAAGAIALAVASRVLLTVTEVAAALAGLLIRRRSEGPRRD